ncbi:MAG: DNA repair protein RecN [Lachnospiraceae bacterium]|nr:DNA repair protein RecN [Lachnospiraceae bacterium]
MLQSLQVKNLALIEEEEVFFSDGLNILTGETGAGKSILIGSINLALGEKVSKEMLREGTDSAFVELVFHVEDEKTLLALREMDIEPEDGEVILSRRITAQRTVAKINGESVPGKKLKEAAAVLIDIHGQHEHQSLLSKKKHLEILDSYAKEELAEKKAKLAESYKTYRKLHEEFEQADIGAEEREKELSFLNYEVSEIEAADLKVNEDEELEAEYRRIANGKKILEAMGNAYQSTGSDGASGMVGHAVRELMSIASYDQKAEEILNQASELDDLLNDLNREMSDYLSAADFNEAHFYEVESRLDLINHIKSKFGSSIEAVLSACEEKKTRIETLLNYDQYLSQLKKQTELEEANLRKLSDEVSKIRQEKAKELTEKVKNELLELNFLDVSFTMDFQKTKDFTANGMDDCEFMISTNPGEPVKPLLKVASGGELSRIMLGIKTVLAKEDEIDTLIFDEIDTGISGRTAQKVSEMLKILGKSHQIICITHLPQIAAMADHHFLIEKSVDQATTHTHIEELSDEASVEELARMLGGVEITDAVIMNAREMKKLAVEKGDYGL